MHPDADVASADTEHFEVHLCLARYSGRSQLEPAGRRMPDAAERTTVTET